MTDSQPQKKVVRAFDVRTVIGALLGVYGVVLLVMGLVATSAEDLDRAGGMNINLTTGIALTLVGAGFLLWVRLRPLVVPAAGAGPGDAEEIAEGTDGRPARD
jgi:hypothetical protein